MRIASGGSNRFWRQAWALEGSAHDTDVIWLMKPERHPAIYRKYARRPLPQAWPAEDHSNTLLAAQKPLAEELPPETDDRRQPGQHGRLDPEIPEHR
jgi:hypothetical protein